MATGSAYASVNYAFAALFGVAAILQYNDPDRWRWIGVYAAAVLICVAYRRVAWAWMAAALLAVIAAIWGGLLLAKVSGVIGVGDLVRRMGEKGGLVEVGREAGGLAIVFAWMTVLVFASLRAQRMGESSRPDSTARESGHDER
jgi:hypothetical protein